MGARRRGRVRNGPCAGFQTPGGTPESHRFVPYLLPRETVYGLHRSVHVILASNPEEDENGIDTIVQPDLMIICDGDKITGQGYIGAPDLVAGILSPSTSARYRAVKTPHYGRHGVREYRIVAPGNRVIHRYALKAGKYLEPESFVYE